MALAGQSLHRPISLRRCRSSVASTRLSSRFCSSVRRGFAGLVADLWLAVPARVLRPGLVCFGFLGHVLPVLAGLGRMKVNSKVPPIARVCGVLTTALATRMGYPCGWERCCNSGHRLPGCSDPVGEGATALAVDAITRQLEGLDAQALYCLRSKVGWSRRFIGHVDSAYPAARS